MTYNVMSGTLSLYTTTTTLNMEFVSLVLSLMRSLLSITVAEVMTFWWDVTI